jgi:hypothetical protein
MLQCEAREWLARYRKQMLELGKREAWGWWEQTIADIEKKRGKEAADQLRKAMNEESSKNRRQSATGR